MKYYVILNLQNTRLFNDIFRNKEPYVEAMSVCLLYEHAAVFYSEVQILVALLIFVAMEFLSPYLTENSLHLSSLWRFFRDYILISDRIFYPPW
jgi:hypothetical protein